MIDPPLPDPGTESVYQQYQGQHGQDNGCSLSELKQAEADLKHLS